MNLEGLIPLVGGIGAFLMAHGTLGGSTEQMAEYRRKYGTAIKVLAVIVIIFGALQLFGVLR